MWKIRKPKMKIPLMTTDNFHEIDHLGNTIAGALGGVGGGQILTALLPMLAGTADNVDIGAIIGQAVGGGVAGAIVTFVVGLIKSTMAGQPAR